jgi:polygalacturonase
MHFSVQSKNYNLQELGADVTGRKNCSELINKTIEKASSEGGGTLYFPEGKYLTWPIYMKSNITLQLESGAVVNIHISNVTGNNIKRIGYIAGLVEMPVENISFSNIVMSAREGFKAETAKNIRFHNVDFAVEKGASIAVQNCKGFVLENVRSSTPLPNQAIIELIQTENVLVNNCFQLVPADFFCKTKGSDVIWGNNFLKNVKTEIIKE